MFRSRQFTFPERANFVSCPDQKLSTLQAKVDSLQHYWQESFDGDSFVSQSRFDACAM